MLFSVVFGQAPPIKNEIPNAPTSGHLALHADQLLCDRWHAFRQTGIQTVTRCTPCRASRSHACLTWIHGGAESLCCTLSPGAGVGPWHTLPSLHWCIPTRAGPQPLHFLELLL
eukprot:scaffold201682_cov19-Tisochrysis_lutea.AAC.1